MSETEIRPFYLNSNLFRVDSNLQSVGLSEGDGADLPSVYQVSAGNVGNGYGAFALSKHIRKPITASNELASIYSGLTVDSSRKLARVINRRFSHVVFALQDQIRSSTPYPPIFPYEALTEFLRDLNVPVVVASLGINEKFKFESSARFARRLDSRLINFVKLLGKKSPFLGVRGFETARFLEQLGIESEVIGCPSMFRRSLQELKNLQTERDRLWPGAEVSGGVIATSEVGERLLRRANAVVRQDVLDYGSTVIGNRSYLYPRNPEELEEAYRGQRLAFGSRMHGAIAALNEGLATSVTNSDARTREMAKLIGLRRFSSKSGLERLTPERLFNETSRGIDPERFSTASANYWKFLLRAGLIIPNHREAPSRERCANLS